MRDIQGSDFPSKHCVYTLNTNLIDGHFRPCEPAAKFEPGAAKRAGVCLPTVYE
jgi:hypothetical protein